MVLECKIYIFFPRCWSQIYRNDKNTSVSFALFSSLPKSSHLLHFSRWENPCQPNNSRHLHISSLSQAVLASHCLNVENLSVKCVRHFCIGSSNLNEADASPVVLTEENLHSLVSTIVKEASKLDVMATSLPLPAVRQCILSLHNCGFHPTDIATALSSHPKYISKKLIERVQMLLSNGFHHSQILSILLSFDTILNLSAGQIEEVIDLLRTSRFSEKDITKILAKNPAVLLLSKSAITQRISILRSLFKTGDVITLTLQSPELLTDEWNEIQAKFDYVFHEMKVTQRQMVHAYLFRHSLQHIKTRHAFLVRAGLFDLSKVKEGEKSPNANLDEIINSSDEKFCQKFGKFQVNEYRTFYKLFDKENVVDSDEED